MNKAEAAEFAMLLEVCASCKPGNIDRFHDYDDTKLQHFLNSAVCSRSVFDEIDDLRIGEGIYNAVLKTNCHSGGNTHFGAFILLIPLLKGSGICGAEKVISETDSEDAVMFYKAFGLTQVRMNKTDDLDVNDPASIEKLRAENMTLYDVMNYSSKNDMVAREWINGFELTRKAADLLIEKDRGYRSIPEMFLNLMAEYPDTFIAKKFGFEKSVYVMNKAKEVLSEKMSIESFDELLLRENINPGSLADICIAGIFTALTEGWKWD